MPVVSNIELNKRNAVMRDNFVNVKKNTASRSAPMKLYDTAIGKNTFFCYSHMVPILGTHCPSRTLHCSVPEYS